MGCGKCHGHYRYEQRHSDSRLVRPASNTSRVGKLPDEGFEPIAAFAVVLKCTETRRCGRKQTDLARLCAFVSNFHSLFHVADEKRFGKRRVCRMRLDCFPDANSRWWKEDQCLYVWRQLLAESCEVEITLVSA